MMTNTLAPDQTAKFEARLERLRRAQSRVNLRLNLWAAREDRYALGRLLVAVAIVTVLVGFYKKLDASQVFLGWICFFAAFFAMSFVHRKLKRVRSRLEGLTGVLSAEMMRLQRDWIELRKNRPPFADEVWRTAGQPEAEHPYRSDFDLAGLPALWLDTCTLEEGCGKLAEEMLTRGRAPLSEEDLQLRVRRTDELAVQSKALRRWESYRFGSWASDLHKVRDENLSGDNAPAAADATEDAKDAHSALRPETQRLLLEAVLFVLVIVQLVIWTRMFLPGLIAFMESADTARLSEPMSVFVPVLLVSALIWEMWRRKVVLISGALGLRELKVLNALEDVQKCVAGVQKKGLIPVSAGRRFRFLRLTFELAEVRRNPIVWILLNVLVPYDAVSFAVTLMAHRTIDGRFQDWWKDVVDFDFHAALARVQLENPEFTHAQTNAQVIRATAMAHPLLPASSRVGNDVHLDNQQRCMLLTGSNMAGKSTLLRAVGMNALLAQMGSVVCARSFALPRVEILCAIQVSDSLESGASYFYAEVRRLVSVLDSLRQKSGDSEKLFLIDEIFRGTNNRERFLGSWQVISALLNTGAYGVLTTHDLALTRLENEVEGVRNFHLRETVGSQGQLEFDYLLRSGPCPTTNALIIMQQAGLPVALDFKPAAPQGELHHV
jgi:hypothetical protein